MARATWTFPPGYRRSREVHQQFLAFAGWHAHADRVRAQRPRRTPIRSSDARTAAPSNSDNRDHSLTGGAARPLAEPSDVVAANNRHDRHLALSGLARGDVGRERGGDVPEPVLAVHERARGGLFGDLGSSVRNDESVADRLQVSRDADHAMGVVTYEVALDKELGHLCRDL